MNSDHLVANTDPGTLSDYMTNGSEDRAAALQDRGSITVYRVVPKGKMITPGDWVFDTKAGARDFLNQYGTKRGLSEIVSKTVPLHHLSLPIEASGDVMDGSNSGEFVYVGQLTAKGK